MQKSIAPRNVHSVKPVSLPRRPRGTHSDFVLAIVSPPSVILLTITRHTIKNAVGEVEGWALGHEDGPLDGNDDGWWDGITEGCADGLTLGCCEG